jgi:hypothetical protein
VHSVDLTNSSAASPSLPRRFVTSKNISKIQHGQYFQCDITKSIYTCKALKYIVQKYMDPFSFAFILYERSIFALLTVKKIYIKERNFKNHTLRIMITLA